MFADGRAGLSIGGRLSGAGPVPPGPTPRPDPVTLGSTGDGREWFRGVLDEVRISSVARYEGDFTPARRHEPDEKTIALYHMDEGEGDTLEDAGPLGNDATIVDATWIKNPPDEQTDRNQPR